MNHPPGEESREAGGRHSQHGIPLSPGPDAAGASDSDQEASPLRRDSPLFSRGHVGTKSAHATSTAIPRMGCMAKPAVTYACSECGYTAGRWFGKCPGCAEFGTLVEEVAGQVKHAKAPPKPLLRLVDVKAEEASRISTGVPELDRVLGGGLVPASLVLVGGEPGVGKSTLLLTALAEISKARRALL